MSTCITRSTGGLEELEHPLLKLDKDLETLGFASWSLQECCNRRYSPEISGFTDTHSCAVRGACALKSFQARGRA